MMNHLQNASKSSLNRCFVACFLLVVHLFCVSFVWQLCSLQIFYLLNSFFPIKTKEAAHFSAAPYGMNQVRIFRPLPKKLIVYSNQMMQSLLPHFGHTTLWGL